MSRPWYLPIAALLVITACSGGEDEEPSAPAELGPVDSRVEVNALDIAFQPEDLTAEAGEVGFVLENEGSIRHTLVIEEVEGFKLEVSGRGDTDTGTVTLAPGTYQLFCDVPGHRGAGMVATMTIE